MTRFLLLSLTALSLGACLPWDASGQPKTPTQTAASNNGDVQCHEESLIGSNRTQTVCRSRLRTESDRDSQIRFLQGTHAGASTGSSK